MKKKSFTYAIVLLVFILSLFPANAYNSFSAPPEVHIVLDPYSVVYEGDIVPCVVTGNVTYKYWQINNQSHHTTFSGVNPVIFDPEPTPLNETFVNFTVVVENEYGTDSETIPLMVKRIYFGDIHWHSTLCDGMYPLNKMYSNAVADHYLDFAAYTGHGEFIDRLDIGYWRVVFQNLLHYIMYGRNDWETIKSEAEDHYTPGEFTTFLGFEWSACQAYPGGFRQSKYGWEDVSHINFYYRDVYPEAMSYSAWKVHTYDDIFQKMSEEADKGRLSIGFTHHPVAKAYWMKVGNRYLFPISFTVNWSVLASKIENSGARNRVFRGVEVYSQWGTAIGRFSELPITWSYAEEACCDKSDYWVESAFWEWSKHLQGVPFVMIASSDIHKVDRPGSAEGRITTKPNPAGIVAVYAVHNTREEIWDALNNCSAYASQLLKIRANVRFDDQMALGQWINCSSPLRIRITAHSTFPGEDCSGKTMCPHGYLDTELAYPIQDIWLLKKDRIRGKPWCKVIGHVTPNKNLVVVNFEDPDVQPNDFYYVAIRQKGQLLDPDRGIDEYMAFLGPVFINQVNLCTEESS
ncbi:MAG TPA: DUF3604 domain-containing protein [Thermoplasmatales archaeon]|nr:DUF3604 domain-containing protein [Thermoplasmatales archaeon]